MGSGAAGMAAIGRQLSRIPDESTAELVRWFVPRSKKVGGKMRWFGRNVQLSSKQVSRKRRASQSTVVLMGTPAACWSIKTYGRRGNYVVRVRRAEALNLTSVAPGVMFDEVTIRRPVDGDRRWERLVFEADRKYPDLVAELVDRSLR